MALFKSSLTKTDKNTGFGTNASYYGGRFITKDGEPNVEKSGVGVIRGTSVFHMMLTISRLKFLFIVLSYYVLVNLLFSGLYCYVGTENLNGIDSDEPMSQFIEAFFFSVQTFTTVGYGHLSPSGFVTNTIAALEALFGLLSIALATGLFYGRFSKPKAYVKFSEKALIAPYRGGKALMVRLTPFKNANLTDAEVKMTLAMAVMENGERKNKFYTLDLELDKLNLLSLSWTLVHPLTKSSPLFEFSKEDYESVTGELIIYLKGFDDMFSNIVVKRTSYTFGEVIYGAKFITMFSKNSENTHTVLHVDQLNEYEQVDFSDFKVDF